MATPDPSHTRQIECVGRDSHGEPTAMFSGKRDPDDSLGRWFNWVIPITEDEHLQLSEALARTDEGFVRFDVPQSRLDMADGAQQLRR